MAPSKPSASCTCHEGAFHGIVLAPADGLYVPPVASIVSVCTSCLFAIFPTIRYRLGCAEPAAGIVSARTANAAIRVFKLTIFMSSVSS